MPDLTTHPVGLKATCLSYSCLALVGFKKLDLAKFSEFGLMKFGELSALLLLLGKSQHMLPKPRFSKPIFGHSTGSSTTLDRPYRQHFRQCFLRADEPWTSRSLTKATHARPKQGKFPMMQAVQEAREIQANLKTK